MATQLPVEIWPAEVKEVIYLDDNPNLIYGIKIARLTGPGANDDTSTTLDTAIPLNYNILRIPIVGEVVLILENAPSSYATGIRNAAALYYLDVVSLQGSVHHNALPTVSNKNLVTNSGNTNSNNYENSSTGNTRQSRNPKVDNNFIENPTAKPLQHYVGDVIIEGRYGHSLRFTTTPKSGNFAVTPKFTGSEGNPITILRNSKQGTDTKKINDFQTETFTNEDNVLVLSSGQNLEFDQSSKVLSSINSKKITSWKDENWGTTPQALLSSGRIIFNSTQQEIIAFAKNGIGLSSDTSIGIDAKEDISLNSKKIELGTDANEPLILGNKFKTWAENLIDTLATLTVITPAGPSSPLSASPQWASIVSIKSRIPTILSDLAFTKKTASVRGGTSKFSELPQPDFTVTPEKIQKKQEEQEAAKEKAADPNLTQDEKNAQKDVANKSEQEIKTQELVTATQPVIIETEDIIDNSAEISAVQIRSTLSEEEEEALIEEESQPEAEADRTDAPGNIDESTYVIDYEIEEDEVFEVEFGWETVDYSIPTTTSYSNTVEVPQETINFGIKVAELANKEVSSVLRENPIGSNGLGNARIATMLNNVKCKPGNAPWHAAAVATFFKESGLPIPDNGASTAQGWLKWSHDTNRLSNTPMVGSAVILGTIQGDGKNKVETAVDIGIVVQVIDNQRVMAVHVVSGELKVTEVNLNATIGFVIPSKEEIKKTTYTAQINGELGSAPGYIIVTDPNGRKHIVFQQGGSKSGPWGKNGKPAPPWNHVPYGRRNQTTFAEAGCGIFAVTAVIRNLTGNPEADPLNLGARYGGNRWGLNKENPADRSNFHTNGSIRTLIPTACKDFGLQCIQTSDFNKVKDIMVNKEGYLIVVGSGNNPFSKGGHYSYVYHFDGKYFYSGNSTLFRNGKKHTWEELRSARNVAMWGVWKA